MKFYGKIMEDTYIVEFRNGRTFEDLHYKVKVPTNLNPQQKKEFIKKVVVEENYLPHKGGKNGKGKPLIF